MKTIGLTSQKKIKLDSLQDLFGIPEGWSLCAWPISYNGSVSFIFRNAAEGDVETEEDDKVYHFKVCTTSDFGFSHIVQRDIALEGLALVSLFFWEHGHAIVVRDKNDFTVAEMYDEHEKVVSHINVGQDACRLMVARDGRIAVGYAGDLRDEGSPCFAVYSINGDVLYECHDDAARSCMDITIDSKDNVWASCFPSIYTYRVSTKNSVRREVYPIASTGGLIPIRINNKQRMIQVFNYDECYAPISYLPIEDEIFRVKFDDLDDMEIEGSSAYAGLAILLTKSNELHVFDLDQANQMLP